MTRQRKWSSIKLIIPWKGTQKSKVGLTELTETTATGLGTSCPSPYTSFLFCSFIAVTYNPRIRFNARNSCFSLNGKQAGQRIISKSQAFDWKKLHLVDEPGVWSRLQHNKNLKGSLWRRGYYVVGSWSVTFLFTAIFYF